MNHKNEQWNSADENPSDSADSVDKFGQLITELHVARLSTPSEDALTRYYQLAEQIEKRSDASIWQKIKATLFWDSREQLVAQGARGASGGSYRMVYAAESTEIEIMIESQTHSNYIEGDIVLLPQSAELSGDQTAALISLLPAASSSAPSSSTVLYEVESDVHGRFRFEDIKDGTYDMQIFLLNGSLIEIADIELL